MAVVGEEIAVLVELRNPLAVKLRVSERVSTARTAKNTRVGVGGSGDCD
jgi:hypothetical protein